MPLFDSTTETQQADFAAGFLQNLKRKKDQDEQFFNQSMKMLWAPGTQEVNLPNGTTQTIVVGLTPAQKLASLGTKAGAVFTLAATEKAKLISADASAEKRLESIPERYAEKLRFNPDGTITLAD